MLYEKLKHLEINTQDPFWINTCRLYCYGFRTGGYFDILKQKLEEIDYAGLAFEEYVTLSKIISDFNALIGLRAEPIPTEQFVFRRFFHYLNLFTSIMEKFAELSHLVPFNPIFSLFNDIYSKATSHDGLYVLDWDDDFLSQNGKICLPDQRIEIIQGCFTDIFSLNYAVLMPGSKFYHDHDELWEFHFIDNYTKECQYRHFQRGKIYEVVDADIIAMASNVPHGGFNPPGGNSVKLGFVAGSNVHGPWRFDFNDRGLPSMENLEETKDIHEVNGVHLGPIFSKSTFKNQMLKHSITFPRKECETEVSVATLLDSEYSIEPKEDHIIHILKGEGNVTINHKISKKIGSNCSFVVPKNISCNLSSSDMLLMDFG